MPDIILMDIQMPQMSGLEATRLLKEMPGDRERCLEAGADEYMIKPVGLKKLIKSIQSLLDEKEKKS